MYCEKVDLLLTDAKRWGQDHLSDLSEDCYIEVSISYLVEQGITNKEMMKVLISQILIQEVLWTEIQLDFTNITNVHMPFIH